MSREQTPPSRTGPKLMLRGGGGRTWSPWGERLRIPCACSLSCDVGVCWKCRHKHRTSRVPKLKRCGTLNKALECWCSPPGHSTGGFWRGL